jgi:hypothetical protein
MEGWRLDSSGSGQEPMAGSCEHSTLTIYGGEFLDQLSDYQLLLLNACSLAGHRKRSSANWGTSCCVVCGPPWHALASRGDCERVHWPSINWTNIGAWGAAPLMGRSTLTCCCSCSQEAGRGGADPPGFLIKRETGLLLRIQSTARIRKHFNIVLISRKWSFPWHLNFALLHVSACRCPAVWS